MAVNKIGRIQFIKVYEAKFHAKLYKTPYITSRLDESPVIHATRHSRSFTTPSRRLYGNLRDANHAWT